MADAYRTKGDISISRVIGSEGEGENRLDTHESVLYPAGSLVLAENMTERDRERASNGELDDLLEPVSADEARQAQSGGSNEDYAIFVPEHEAEAHALEAYGHTIVPPEQALELGSRSADYAAQYQGAVREHGLDRRPVQEHLAQRREPLPDELLQGGQTRTGLPHERGPAEYSGVDESQGTPERGEQVAAGQQQVAAEVAAPRQRPGSQQSGGGAESESSETQASNPQQPAQAAPAQAQPQGQQPGPVNPQQQG